MKRIAAVLVAAGVALAAAGVQAADDGWTFELTPYAWLMGLDGEIQVDDKKADFEQKFSDLIESVDGAFSILGVAQYNRLVFLEQLDFFSLSKQSERLTPAGSHLKADIETIFSTTALGWQFNTFGENSTLDVLAGVRVASMDVDISAKGIGEGSETFTAVDPCIVLRPSFQLTEKLRLNPLFSIGGGGDSELVWELQPELQYMITDSLALRAGYRQVHYEFEGDKDNELDITFKGIIVGIGFVF